MKKIILLGVIAVMLLLTASTAMADTIVWQIGVFDDLYGVTDGTKITTSPDRSIAPKGTATVVYTDVSTFYSVLVPVTTITGTFTADLSQGAVLLISWSPGASGTEKFSVTLDEKPTMSSRIIDGSTCTSDPLDGRCGQVPSYYSNYPGLPYYTEIFDFGPVGSGTETHTLSISYPKGNGIGFDYLELSTPAPSECVPPPSDLVSWWPGDGNANDITDGNDGTLKNGATTTAGKVGDAFSLDDVGHNYVEIPDAPNLNPSDEITVDAWIYLEQYKTIPLSNNIIVKDDFVDKKRDYLLQVGYYGNGDQVSFAVFTSNYLGYATSPSGLINKNTWHHVAGTYDGEYVKVYIDGAPVARGTHSGTLSDTDTPFRIGSTNHEPYNRFFDGLIDEVEIFDRALSASEIRAIYFAGSAGKCKNQPPVAVCKDIEIPADENCEAYIEPEDVDGGSYDPDEGDTIELSVNKLGPYGLGEHSVILTVTDEGGEYDTCTAIVTVIDTTPPIPDVAELPDVRGECSVTISAPTATDNCAGIITGTTSDPLEYTEQGTYSVTWTYDDGNENITTQIQTVVVKDTTPPNIESLSASPNVLWPPNHKMVAVNLSTSVSDNCDQGPECQIIAVSSNEPDNGLGDGDTAPDWEITGALTVNLRAERSGTGSGRVYTITVMCTDAYGNSSTETVNVTVPHDKGEKK